ncbi:MAG: hypothetical protein FWC13_02635 [Oscillospiraceae bacterium]|nr:hypothetical protein [Oscillospiraceae bacterium]
MTWREIVQSIKTVAFYISIIIFLIVAFQSYIAFIIESTAEYEGFSGVGGAALATAVLIGAIVGFKTRKGKKQGGIVAGVIYMVGALVGLLSTGVFGDLNMWAVVAALFGVLFIAGSVVADAAAKAEEAENKSKE